MDERGALALSVILALVAPLSVIGSQKRAEVGSPKDGLAAARVGG